jgi:hypothetical protein
MFSQAFYDLHIEDMWLPYFCNTTNILTSTNEIHNSGYAWRYIRRLNQSSFPRHYLTSGLQEHL